MKIFFSEKFESRDFLPAIKNEWKLCHAFSDFFNFFRFFQIFFRKSSFFCSVVFFQKFQKFEEISEKHVWIKFLKNFWKNCQSRDFLLPAIQKWMKTSCFAAVFKLFALLFSNFDEFQKFFIFFREISENFWKKQKNLKKWKFPENFVNPEIFCCQPFQKWGKIAVLLLLSKFSASFSLLLAIPMYQKWRKTSCFAAIFKLFALLFSNSDEFQIFFRHFSESFQRKKISEKIEKIRFFLENFLKKNVNPGIFCFQPFQNEGN